MTTAFIALRPDSPLFRLSRKDIERRFKVRVIRKTRYYNAVGHDDGLTLEVEGTGERLKRLDMEARG